MAVVRRMEPLVPPEPLIADRIAASKILLCLVALDADYGILFSESLDTVLDMNEIDTTHSIFLD